jgi:hypothetical protein
MALITKFNGSEIISCESVNSRIREINSLFPVSISHGGTGATTVEQARANLSSEGYVVLYQNVSGTSNAITLPAKASNCNRWGIFYGINNIGGYQEYDLTNMGEINLSAVYTTSANNLYFRTALAQINKNSRTITLTRNMTFILGVNGSQSISEDMLKIYAVVGYI